MTNTYGNRSPKELHAAKTSTPPYKDPNRLSLNALNEILDRITANMGDTTTRDEFQPFYDALEAYGWTHEAWEKEMKIAALLQQTRRKTAKA